MFYFLLFGRDVGPAQTAKQKHAPAQTAKKRHAPAPSERVLFFAVWAGGRIYVFCCLGRGVFFFFAVWAGGVFIFLLFGRGTGVHSLTGLPGSSLSDPTTKKTEQQKKHGFPQRVHIYNH